jgi:hypothetical protein
MKRIIGLLALVALLLTSSLAFATTIPDGTYVEESGVLSYIFSGNKLTVEVNGNVVNELTYELKDGWIITSDGGENRYTLEGNKLTWYLSDAGTVFTKK